MIELETQKQITSAFLELFKEKIVAIEEKIKFANDFLVQVNYEIEKFHTEEDIFAVEQEISITKIKNNELIDRKILRYNIILGLISEKYKIIQNRITSGFYTDKYDLNEAKISLFKCQIEIHAKKEFLLNYQNRKII